jgi:ornithine carbamoyltransferase
MPITESSKSLAGKDFLSIADFSRSELELLLETARSAKIDIAPYRRALDGKVVVLLFEKASLRTRLTFETGVARLGGHPIYVDHNTQRVGERETIRDYAKNLERWVHAIVARVYRHETVAELASEASIPVINGLSDRDHPCQALADYLTLLEHFGSLKGLRLAYVGDGNNVCNSLIEAGAKLGVDVTAVTPAGFEPSAEIVAASRVVAKSTGATITVSHDTAAVRGHQAVYTDTWISMGQESEREGRLKTFAPLQVTKAMMNLAGPEAVFMHCLPAKRGLEVSAEVMDSPRSVVFDQAENRLHAQNAILIHTVAPMPS